MTAAVQYANGTSIRREVRGRFSWWFPMDPDGKPIGDPAGYLRKKDAAKLCAMWAAVKAGTAAAAYPDIPPGDLATARRPRLTKERLAALPWAAVVVHDGCHACFTARQRGNNRTYELGERLVVGAVQSAVHCSRWCCGIDTATDADFPIFLATLHEAAVHS